MGSSSVQAAQAGNKRVLILGGKASGKTVLAEKYVANEFTSIWT
jgi:polynucleotide 5'-kinase involved in rRNA processing